MSVYSDATFSVNQYDKDGDVVDECVLVHIGTTILRFSTVSQLDVFIERLQTISSEIKGSYYNS
ncbi:hypothetical protein EDM57_04870 [Brevibacillus gelatini]|uniref:Uncharacterized protein n=1 Tax=Brevibacillus gelatini TaxID=1655277 RepID=A0A3M8B919_9BACL|nr:hypothetical protein EDM57_04870 [Brevibacillus gelatini]